MEIIDHGPKAAELFCRGYNCSQSVLLAFSDLTGLDEVFAARLASAFGGGIGRLRETCGALSGMLMAAGLLYGYSVPGDDRVKGDYYALVQRLAGEFRAEAGSLSCREILGNPPTDPTPTPRTAEFYAKRPCAHMALTAARILDRYLRSNPPIVRPGGADMPQGSA